MGVELAEVSSLLSLAMPAANVDSLSSKADGEAAAAAAAIEVRPRERTFEADAAPVARYCDILAKKSRPSNPSTGYANLDSNHQLKLLFCNIY